MIKELVELEFSLKLVSRLDSFDEKDIIQASLDNTELKNYSFKDLTLEAENLFIDVSKSIFEKCFFVGLRPKQAIFQKVKFKNCNFSGADLRKASFKECIFEGCTLLGANLSTAKLNKVLFKLCKLEDTFFVHSTLNKLEFEGLELKKVSFNESQLSSCVFSDCTLSECNFSNGTIKNSTFPSSSFDVNFGLKAFSGLKLSSIQVTQLAPSLALEAGITIED